MTWERQVCSRKNSYFKTRNKFLGLSSLLAWQSNMYVYGLINYLEMIGRLRESNPPAFTAGL
jgi:hypothetical protein